MENLEKQIKLMNVFYENLEGATDKEKKDILEGIAILAKKIILITNKI